MPLSTPPISLSPGQFQVLKYLHENGDADGKCYRCVRQIAHETKLSRSYVDQVTTQLVKLKIISREKMWKLDSRIEESEDYPRWITPRAAEFEQRCGFFHYYPVGNMYKLLAPAGMPEDEFYEGYYVNIEDPADFQLSLPFPPHEKTILARGARFTQHLELTPLWESSR